MQSAIAAGTPNSPLSGASTIDVIAKTITHSSHTAYSTMNDSIGFWTRGVQAKANSPSASVMMAPMTTVNSQSVPRTIATNRQRSARVSVTMCFLGQCHFTQS